ncbi:DUF2793 domain-containing protein [Aminobacter sp. J44]|uniref:DUF2793 domain-containing protein n=1 Tax=Aminobacter sp. J44 TaxID=935262 RepID=UPI00119C1960|nr:DUF2793 domain-containing protein [Aminobacter sp. J44]TWG55043.1 uncharacterized protein DUF2793 [Aminobacter sp. J44]
MENTPNLDLPYILPSQAQKHVTHNEALDALDAVVQLSVLDRDLAAPPPGPDEGDRYIVAAPASGEWTGQEDRIAVFRGGGWLFVAPRQGWLAFAVDEGIPLCFAGGAWKPLGETLKTLQAMSLVGIGTTADAVNPFSARLNKALWTALASGDGGDGDLRFTMNKEGIVNTASLLFQSGWSGRAEIGLAGSDDLAVKVSPDGSTWHQAYAIERASGAMAVSGAIRFDHGVGIGRQPPIVGGLYFNRSNGNPFVVLSGGEASAPVEIGQLRGSSSTGAIGFTNASLGWGVAYRTSLNRVGILTDSPDYTLSVNGIAAPHVDNAYSCGTASRRWSTIYAATGAINTSDARDKVVEAQIGAAAARIVDVVEPVLYRWKVGGVDVVEAGTERIPDGENAGGEPVFIERPITEEQPRPGVRLHAGWLAQDVKTAFDAEGLDCGAWGLDAPDDAGSRQWLRPDQLLAFLWEALRQTRRELKALVALQPA